MRKIERNYYFEGDIYELVFESEDVKCFKSKDSFTCVVTDKNDNVLFSISADEAQGQGFLVFHNEQAS